MDDSTNKIIQYCLDHSSPQTEVLYELERETYLRTLAPQMLSGHLQGLVLNMISKMIHPKRILELGTFTGYSAICLAQGLSSNGLLHTIEVNEEMQPIIQKYIEKAGLKEKIIPHTGDAVEIVPTLEDTFDLVFIDAGKKDYEAHFELVINKVRQGGFILVDNVLWSQKVIADKLDQGTRIVDLFNKKIQNDPRVENVILPIRDGITLIRKL
jgi:predicted O-methyltransferase YrrM